METKFKFISGLANCHLPGLYSFVIASRLTPNIGMRRIFYTTRDIPLWNEDKSDFHLKPHNHRQNIVLRYLFGNAKNVKLVNGNQEGAYFYELGSALLNGEFSLKRLHGTTGGWNLESEDINNSTYLDWSDIHTVVADKESAWLVDEFELAPTYARQICLSRNENLTLSSEGLYVPLDKIDLEVWEEFIERKCQKGLL